MKLWLANIKVTPASGLNNARLNTENHPGTNSLINRRYVLFMTVLLCSLEILDGIITHWAVTKGIVREGNPLIIHVAIDWSFVLVKSIGAVLSAMTLIILYKYFPRLSLISATIISFFYVAVLAWNSGIIFIS
jgi:hypothetical protein